MDSNIPAFPVSTMTLRDYFAGQVLQGLSANPHEAVLQVSTADRAAIAYRLADAMLEAREDTHG